jgi:acyl-CoA thioesterase-2
MAASFQGEEEGFEHQIRMPDVPGPDQLPSEAELQRAAPRMPDPVRRYYERERPIEFRPVEFERYLGRKFDDARFNVWIRANGSLPDNADVHRCVLAYASDMTLLDPALIPHGHSVFEKEIMAASLDHALWMHRSFRADEWLLYAQESPGAGGGRGFARGLIFTQSGRLVASVAQEGVIRLRRPPA